ncbi:5794_t:CDS:2 [Ambispora gerdemannii]|uniref:5794_t:CDS:1 n=1 Tax=Ambispora gerdemannii TaxID=144530 RepID=A0A9N8Z6E5_9GLOM|nr:5794_t:CDS:2 [Ambispora gerdemannii]
MLKKLLACKKCKVDLEQLLQNLNTGEVNRIVTNELLDREDGLNAVNEIFSKNYNGIVKTGEESLAAFNEAAKVLKVIVTEKWKNIKIKETLCVVIWKDDCQIEMEHFFNSQSNIIQIRNYNYEPIENSSAAEQDVILVPILSGIFGGDVKEQLLEDVLEKSPFKLRISISDIGGVARFASLGQFFEMQDFIQSFPILDGCFVHRTTDIATFPKSALRELIRRIVTGTSVSDGTQLSETYLDLNRYGIFCYPLLSNGRFLIMVPYILLWKLNNNVSVLPSDLLTFLCRKWTRQNFEKLECKIKPSVEQEVTQCIPRTRKYIRILLSTVFLCYTGNPAIDSHSCRKGRVIASEVIRWYNKAMEKFENTDFFHNNSNSLQTLTALLNSGTNVGSDKHVPLHSTHRNANSDNKIVLMTLQLA